MRKVTLLLGIIALLLGVSDHTESTVLIQSSGAVSQAADWTNSFVAVWTMDSTGNEPNQSTNCGSDCDVTENSGTIALDNSFYIEGTGSRNVLAADTENFICNMSTTCEELALTSSGDFSIVSWFAFDSAVDTGDTYIVDHLTGTNAGFRFHFESSVPGWRALYGDGGTNRIITLDPAADPVADTWYHVAFTHDNGTGQVVYGKSGSSIDESQAASNTQNYAASDDTEFDLLSLSTNRGDLFIDEVGIIDELLSANAVCKICSCGIDGSACTYSGSTWTDKGRSDTACGSCLGDTTCVNTSTPSACS
jgi:hypothetical protein